MTLELRKLGGLCGQFQACGRSLAGSPGSGDQLPALLVLCWFLFLILLLVTNVGMAGVGADSHYLGNLIWGGEISEGSSTNVCYPC